jgi:AhpD family alkylhydroperoxidase
MDWKAYMAGIGQTSRALEKAAPETAPAYRALSAAAKADGALDVKTKELIALGIAAGIRCEPCIGFHARALAQLGASRAEVVEAMGMVMSMQGGPGYMYAGKALEAFDQFSYPSA